MLCNSPAVEWHEQPDEIQNCCATNESVICLYRFLGNDLNIKKLKRIVCRMVFFARKDTQGEFGTNVEEAQI